MRQLRVYKSLDIVYFDFWDTTTSTAIPITNDMADSISASIIHKPPTVDKIAFWHIYGNSQIVSYQFDMITDNLGVPYNTSTAQLAFDAITMALGLSAGGGGGDASATNQLLEIGELQDINNNIGSKSDAAAVDDTGEFSLIALIKRYLQRFTAFIASFGAAADTAAASDTANTGLISLIKRVLNSGIKLRDGATNNLLNFGVQPAANSVPVVFGQNPLYSVAVNYSISSTPTDFFGITGSATKKVKVVSIKIYAQESQVLGGGTIRTMSVIRRSTNNTGGTTTPVVRVPLDSSSLPATAVVVAYTGNPTVGLTVGTIGAHQLTHPNNSTINAQYGLELITSPVVLNNASEALYLNGLGVTRPNNSYSITINWEEY